MNTGPLPSSTLASRTACATWLVISCSPCARVVTLNCLTIRARFERRHGGQRLALEEFEERAASGRDVIDVVGDAELVDRRDRIAAAGDRVGLRLCDRARQRLSAFGEGVVLEHAHWAVPHDGAGFLKRGR